MIVEIVEDFAKCEDLVDKHVGAFEWVMVEYKILIVKMS
jgi:hypothetical protein